MKTYAISDYGLYVTETDLEAYAKSIGCDAYELLLETGNHYGGADGECYHLMKNEESFNCDDSFSIFPLENYPSLFKQAYECAEAAMKELKSNYSHFLRDDFDYNNKFVRLVGTVFG